MRRIQHAIRRNHIRMISNVIKPAAQCPIPPEEMKPFLQLHIRCVVSRQPKRPRRIPRINLALIGSSVKRQPGARLSRINQIHLMQNRQLEKRHNSPEHNPVRRIPRIRPGQLRTQQRNIQTEIEHLIRIRPRSRISPENFVVLVKPVPRADLKSVIAIVAPIFQIEVPVNRSVQRVVRKPPRTPFLQKFQLKKNRMRQLLLQPNAPVQIPRRSQRIAVHKECSRNRGKHRRIRRRSIHIRRIPARIEEVIGPLTVKRLINNPQAGSVVNNSNPRRKFRVPLIIEDVSPRQPRRKCGRAHDLIPIKPQARFNQQSIRRQPAVFRISARLRVISSRVISPGENRIPRTARRKCRQAVRPGSARLRHLSRRRLVGLQKRNRFARKLRRIIQMIDVGPDLDVMPSMKLMRRQIQIRNPLQPRTSVFSCR